jgi:hypothetical protein
LNDSAQQLFEGGRYGRAARLYMQALEIDPSNKRAQAGLAKCREIMREMRQGGGQGLGERRRQRSNNP